MTARSDEIIGEMIEWATKHRREMLKDLWLLSDFARGRKVDPSKIIAIVDKFDQTKENVKTIRRELKI